MCPARGNTYAISFVQFPFCSRSADERGMHSSFHRSSRMQVRAGFGHPVSTNRQRGSVLKISPSNLLPAGHVLFWGPYCCEPDINPGTQLSHCGTITFVAYSFVRLQPFLHWSSEPFLPQQASPRQSATISVPVLK